MQYQFFVGVDVSKLTLDVAITEWNSANVKEQIKVSNDDDGINQLIEWVDQQTSTSQNQVLFCMEPTGMYCYPLLQYLVKKNIPVWVENATQIKRSMGMVRGKSDRIDARRIAEYAARNQNKIRLWKPLREVVEQLKHLASLRDRLVETKKRLLTPVEELNRTGDEATAKMLKGAMNKSILAIERDIDGVERKMKHIINDDEGLKKLYSLVTSVVGIGFVTAVNLIIHTNEFTLYTDIRKLACYCGVAPFEYSSGTSVRGRRRVHPVANKKLKTNLHMGSLTGVKLDEDLNNYFERKVAEGKNKMSVLNAVRNKLLARVLAVVKRRTPYEKKISESCLVLS